MRRAPGLLLTATLITAIGSAHARPVEDILACWRQLGSVFRKNPAARELPARFEVAEGGAPEAIPETWIRAGGARLRKELTNSERRLLGQGKYGEVYRIQSKNPKRSDWILKITTTAEKENGLLSRLREICRGRDCGFQIARSELIEARIEGHGALKLSDTRGRSIYSLMTDPSVDEALKRELERKYHERFDRLRASLDGYAPEKAAPQDKYFFGNHPPGTYPIPLDGLPILKAKIYGHHLWELLLKSDNVIVDPHTLEMTIVDPY